MAFAFLDQHSAVHIEAAGRNLVDDLGTSRRKSQHVPVLYNHGLRHLQRKRQPRMGSHVAQLAMHGHRNLRPDPAIHLRQLVARGMPRHMDEMILFRQHLDAEARQLVLQFKYRELVSRNDAGGKNHGVAGAQAARSGDRPRRRGIALPAARPGFPCKDRECGAAAAARLPPRREASGNPFRYPVSRAALVMRCIARPTNATSRPWVRAARAMVSRRATLDAK